MSLSILPDELLRLIISSTDFTISLRSVCKPFQIVFDSELEETSKDVIRLLSSCRVGVRCPRKLREMQMMYVRRVEPIMPLYVCSSCGDATLELGGCRSCAVRVWGMSEEHDLFFEM